MSYSSSSACHSCHPKSQWCNEWFEYYKVDSHRRQITLFT